MSKKKKLEIRPPERAERDVEAEEAQTSKPVRTTDLDEMNMERVEKSRKRIAKAICAVERTGLSDFYYWATDPDVAKVDWLAIQKQLAKAIHFVAASREEMGWACKHFGWNDDVVSDMDAVLERLGVALAKSVEEDFDDSTGIAFESVSKMAGVLAILTTWNDDEDVVEYDG